MTHVAFIFVRLVQRPRACTHRSRLRAARADVARLRAALDLRAALPVVGRHQLAAGDGHNYMGHNSYMGQCRP